MPRIKMSGGYVLMPAGDHIFRIFGVDYNEEFGIITIYLINAQGMTHRENFHLMNGNVPNTGAMNAFSYFAKTAMNDFGMEDIDPQELVGHYIGCEVVHNVQPSKRPGHEGESVTFANLGDKWVADKFDTDPVPVALTKVLTDADRPRPKDQPADDRASRRAQRRAQAAPEPVQPVTGSALDDLLGSD